VKQKYVNDVMLGTFPGKENVATNASHFTDSKISKKINWSKSVQFQNWQMKAPNVLLCAVIPILPNYRMAFLKVPCMLRS
jgi:hypothetical protein